MNARETVKCDVLVIGSGAAGLMAAIEANGFGASVLVVGKCRLGNAHTLLAAGGINAALGTMDPKDSWEMHAADTIVEGGMINNPQAVGLLCKNAEHAIHELISMGAEFARDKNGKLLQRFFGAHTFRRTCFAGDHTGKEMLNVLVKQAKKIGIKQHEFVYITQLLKNGKQVNGAMGLNLKNGKIIVFEAKAVVLATGGHSRLYSRSSSRDFENTGDGCFLAFENGVELADMEMLQFHPTGMVWPEKAWGILVTEAVRGEGGKLYNADNERFMKAYHPRMELGPRDVVARAIFQEIEEGRGTEHGGVWLDITHKTKKYILQRLPKIYWQFRKYLNKDISKERMEVAPTAHYSMGGIAVKPETGETSMQGLFAVGEATAGTHGANRLGGNSLLECIVFGKIVGEHAAGFAKRTRQKTIAKKEIKKAIKEISQIFGKKNRENAKKIKQELQEAMWEHCGVIRERKAMEKGLEKISEIKKDSRKIKVKKISDFVTAMDLKALIALAEIVLKSALFRTESRGAHARSDYQKTKKEWQANVYCKKIRGKTKLFKKKINKPGREIVFALKKHEKMNERSADVGAEGLS